MKTIKVVVDDTIFMSVFAEENNMAEPVDGYQAKVTGKHGWLITRHAI